MKEVLTKVFRKGRWYVSNGKGSIPFANYVWLRGNPSFREIPKGYVIHHLDRDPLNDDISNLVLMQKHHHMAYHFKHKIIEPEIKIHCKGLPNNRNTYFPVTEPKIREYRKGRYCIRFNERIDGTSERTQVYRWKGQTIKSLEMANKIKEFLWSSDDNSMPIFTQS